MSNFFNKKKEPSNKVFSQRVDIWQEPKRLSHMVPWLTIDPQNGVIYNNDYSMMAVYSFRGPDMESATPQELIFFNANVNNVIRRLPKGYVLYMEAQRRPTTDYVHSKMPTPILQAMEDIRANFFQSEHFYESQYYFIIYKEPTNNVKRKITNAFMEDNRTEHQKSEDSLMIIEEETTEFLNNVNQFGTMLKGVFKELEPMTNPDDIMTFLHAYVSDRYHPVTWNPTREINSYICDSAFIDGKNPKLGDSYLKVITLLDFPLETVPGILDALNQLNINYRWTSRFICLGEDAAKKELQDLRKRWDNQAISLYTRISRMFTKRYNEMDVDQGMIDMANDTAAALDELNSGAVAMGYYTMTLCLFADTEKDINQAATQVQAFINKLGYTAFIENWNTAEAWRGSMPGCPRCNVRRPLVSSLNFCHSAPTTAQWSGDKWNKHLKGPVLLYTDSYNSQFRLSLHCGALAHTLVCGPSGSGKSVLLNTFESHFMKYPDSRVFVFDKAKSSRIPTYAAGGNFYNISAEEGATSDLSFQPLVNVHKPTERIWARDWLVGFLERGNLTITSSIRDAIDKALIGLSKFPLEQRTISNFCAVVQNHDVRKGLKPLTMQGPYGKLFDNGHNILGTGRWQVYEMEDVMRTPEIVPSTIDYLFHQIDNSLKVEMKSDGTEIAPSGPTMIVLDECWLFFDNPIFRDKIREYFKDLRKKNASIVVATQNLGDIASKQDLLATVLENCPNRIYLRNQNAVTDQVRDYYRLFGCNERQIDIISQLDNQERHEYYYSCMEKGNRVFDLALNPIEAAFVLATDKSDQIHLNKIIAEGKMKDFVKEWLLYKGLHDEWEWFNENYLSPSPLQ
ncbi:conjugal transfer protein TrbE [Veillonella sp.]|uniref:VirB4 family type IV secretion/conjugal transfer ATPase n=1 Tax=Veillonella sp. TaxID=1926307 RepID=UPI0025EBDD76|nr:conjugal transfer protein TrbE [Veillonella sp.]